MPQLLEVYSNVRQQLPLEKILYLEGSVNYCYIHLINRPPILITYHLKQMQQRLPDFVGIHKRYLLNPLFIAAPLRLTPQTKALMLTTGEVLPPARRRVAELAARLKASLEISEA